MDKHMQTAEEFLRDVKARQAAEGRSMDEALMMPLRRALGIAPNDVNAPVDLNDEVIDCVQNPACALTFQDLNCLRESEFRVMRAWVPGWLWALGEHVPPVRALLTKKTHGDLAGKGIGGL